MKLVALALLLLPLAACTSTPVDPTQAFVSLASGTVSGITTPGTRTARDEESLRALWAEHGRVQLPAPTLPSVDFQRHMLVIVSAGSRPSAGYALHVERVQVERGVVVIDARESAPAIGTLQAQVITNPYEVLLLPQSTLPVESRIRH